MRADLLALGAIVLWASLATLATLLSEIPPFLLTGIGLVIGSLISLPLSGFKLSAWKVPLKTLGVGVYGLFGYHLMLFIALQTAPAVEANLVNYLWPLLIVVLAPLFSRHLKLGARHIIAAGLGFAGAAIAITSSGGVSGVLGFEVGYLFALAAAVIWATYSLMTTKLPTFPTSAIGLFGLGGGMGMSMRLGIVGLVTVGVAKTSSGSVRRRSSISMSSAVTPMRTSSEKERCWFLSYWLGLGGGFRFKQSRSGRRCFVGCWRNVRVCVFWVVGLLSFLLVYLLLGFWLRWHF